ncbi:MAG: hypothetical protein KIH01_04125 [Candidatus Freyarchaeota archaeon]|nr:hypothetical protein [Candidatus Jordarchaeia archaeon]
MDGLGIAFAVLFSLLYPLAISLLVWKLRFSGEPLKPLLVAFLIAAVLFYVAYMRKVYVLFLQGWLLYAVDLLATGFIEEAAKLLVLLIPIVRGRMTSGNGVFYGLMVGFGFGAGEALLVLVSASLYISTAMTLLPVLYVLRPIILESLLVAEAPGFMVQLIDLQISTLFSMLLSVTSFAPLIFSLPLIAVYERAIVVLLHGALTGIVGFGLARNQTAKFYLAAVGLHILVDLIAVLYQLGTLANVLMVEAALTFITAAILLYVVKKGGRPAQPA